jgi:anaerobic magnesium-protoporphyrin IX monomethyl ester cyclase
VVYLGVESGSQMGLRTLNKHVTVDQNLAAIELLKKMGLTTGLGFMLFDPSTTFETIQENIAFLRMAASDGAFPINFCKMLPYAGTPIEETLRQQGRLTGSLARPDYDFLDPRVDLYAALTHRIFAHRNFDALGLANRLTLAHADQALNRSLGICPPREEDKRILWEITARSNASVLATLEALLPIAQAEPDGQVVLDLAMSEWECESASIIALDDLLLESDPELLQFFGLDILEREKRLQQAAAEARR